MSQEWPSTALGAAVENRDIVTLRRVIAGGVDVNETYIYDYEEPSTTALIRSCKEGLGGLVRVLLQAGADPNFFTDDVDRPIEAAIQGGHDECVKMLLDHGARVTSECLIRAAKEARLPALGSAGPKAAIEYGGYALGIACDANRPESVRLLLDWGVAANHNSLFNAIAPDASSCVKLLCAAGLPSDVSAMKYALSIRADACLFTLIEAGWSSNVDDDEDSDAVYDTNGWTPLFVAADAGNCAWLKLCEPRANDVPVAMLLAAAHRHIACVEWLARQPANG